MKLCSEVFTINEFDAFYQGSKNEHLGLCKDSFFKSEIFPAIRITLYNNPVLHSHKIYLKNDIVLYWGRNKHKILSVFTTHVQQFLYSIISVPIGKVVSFWYTVEEIKEA